MKLGELLKYKREMQMFTLRQVEEVTGISNAYLSQLENDKIKKPSADVLYKLSSIYKMSLEELLIAAGIIKEDQKLVYKAGDNTLNGIEITKEESEQLLKYLQFLRYDRRKN